MSVSTLSIVKLYLGGGLQGHASQWMGVRTQIYTNRTIVVTMSLPPTKELAPDSTLVLERQCAPNKGRDPISTKTCSLSSQLIANSSAVESLLQGVCDASSIAEFDFKVDGFELQLRRNLDKKIGISGPPAVISTPKVHAPVKVKEESVKLDLATPASTQPASSKGGIKAILEKAKKEGLTVIRSTMIGVFKSKFASNEKRNHKPDKNFVEPRKPIGVVKQLGFPHKIKCKKSCEIVQVLRKNGEAVGYGDPLMAIRLNAPAPKLLK